MRRHYFNISEVTINVSVASGQSAYGSVSGGGTVKRRSNVVITATPNAGHSFVRWDDGDTNASRTVVAMKDETYTAEFSVNSYTITVASESSTKGTVTGGGTYDYGTTQAITATPKTGYHFVRWNDGNTNASRTITVTGNATYTAYFDINEYMVRIISGDSLKGLITFEDETPTNIVEKYVQHGTTINFSATPNVGHHFTTWSDSSTQQARSKTVTGAMTLTATFVADTHSVTVSKGSTPNSWGTVSGGGTFNYGTVQTVSATPSGENYRFSHWTCNIDEYDNNTNQSIQVTIGLTNITLTAVFEAKVSVYSRDDVFDTETLTTAKIVETDTDYAWAAYNTTLHITTSGVTGTTFSKWYNTKTGATVSSTVNTTLTITESATYCSSYNYRIVGIRGKVETEGELPEGTIVLTTSKGEDVTLYPGEETYETYYGETVTIVSTTEEGAHFSRWECDGIILSDTTSPSIMISLTNDCVLTAYNEFNTPDSVTISVSSNNLNFGTVSGSGTYTYGSSVTISATPRTGYHFVRWNDNNTNATRNIIADSDATYTAIFAVNTYTITVNSNDTSKGTASGGGTYDYGTQITLTATPNTGYHFANWRDDARETSSTRTVTVTETKTYTAIFEINIYKISQLYCHNPAYATVYGKKADGTQYVLDSNIQHGDTITLHADCINGKAVNRWLDMSTGSPVEIGSGNDYQLVVTKNYSSIVCETMDVTAYYNITVSAVTGQTSRGSSYSGGGRYAEGQNATISATGVAGYTPSKWFKNGTFFANATFDESSPNTSSITVQVNGNDNYTVEFTNLYTLNVYASGYNSVNLVSYKIDNGEYKTYQLSYTSVKIRNGMTVTINTNILDESYSFDVWGHASGSITEQEYTFIMNSDNTFRTILIHYVTLATSVTPQDGGTISGGGRVVAGSPVTLEVSPSYNYDFLYWDDDHTNTNRNRTVTITDDTTYTAVFKKKTYSVSLATESTTKGTVTLTRNGSSVTSPTTVEYGDTITATASSKSGYVFSEWKDGSISLGSDNPYTVASVTKNYDITGYFRTATVTYTVTCNVSPSNYGYVLGGGNYESGTSVTLTAHANNGYVFDKWNDNSTSPTKTITVTSNVTYTAYFKVAQATTYSVSLSVSPSGTGTATATPSTNISSGGSSSLSASGSTNYDFLNWTENGRVLSTANPYTLSNITSNRTIVAVMQAKYGVCGYAATGNTSYGSVTVDGSNQCIYGKHAGETVTLSATPVSGYVFKRWTDGNTSNPRTYTVTASDATNFVINKYAEFEAHSGGTQYNICVDSTSTLHGTVKLDNIAGICKNVNEGSTYTISCTPASGYNFVGWNDGDTRATRTITATKDATYFAICVAATPKFRMETKNDNGTSNVQGSGSSRYIVDTVNNKNVNILTNYTTINSDGRLTGPYARTIDEPYGIPTTGTGNLSIVTVLKPIVVTNADQQKPTIVGCYPHIETGSVGDGRWSFGINFNGYGSNKYSFSSRVNGTWVDTYFDNTVSYNNPQVVVLTKNSNKLSLYDTKHGSVSEKTVSDHSINISNDMQIEVGCYGAAATDKTYAKKRFMGDLYAVLMFEGTLTTQEVTAIMNMYKSKYNIS